MGRQDVIVRRYESLSAYIAMCPAVYGNDFHGPDWDAGIHTAEAKRRGIKLVAVPTKQACELLDSVKRGETFAVLHVTC